MAAMVVPCFLVKREGAGRMMHGIIADLCTFPHQPREIRMRIVAAASPATLVRRRPLSGAGMKHPIGRRLHQFSRPLYRVARYLYRGLHNLRGDFYRLMPGRAPLGNLQRYERCWYSQNGEDGILEAIFSRIGVTNRFCVEFGVENGRECNSRYLIERKGWQGLRMDGGEHAEVVGTVHREFITAENIVALFRKYGVPQEFDLLSIDIDGNDYWVWRAIEGYSPRAVIIEYNSSIRPEESRTVPYQPDFQWDGTNYFGASLLALAKLGRSKGYTLVGCDSQGANAFFVRDDLVAGRFVVRSVAQLYAAPRYGEVVGGHFIGHHPSPRMAQMVQV